MNITRPAAAKNRCDARRKKVSGLNLYPLLGILLAILLAALTYGGLFLLLS
jgi:hypothetical protein